MLKSALIALAAAAVLLTAAPAMAQCEMTNSGRVICPGGTLPPAQRANHRAGPRHALHRAMRDRHSPGGGSCPYSWVRTAAGWVCIADDVAERMKGFIADVVARGFRGNVHCYSLSKRHVKHSLHFIAEACDFAQRGWGKTVRPMYHVADLSRKWGLRNGCSFGDCGHIDSGRTRAARRAVAQELMGHAHRRGPPG
jgi:hypothetical protein